MGEFQQGFDFAKYPDAPGYSNPTTSKGAAKSVEPQVAAIRRRVLAEIQVRGSFGATCDELEQALELSHQTASARLREMALKSVVKDSGNKRRTRSGRPAIVWVATEGQR